MTICCGGWSFCILNACVLCPMSQRKSQLNFVEFSKSRKEVLVLLHGNGENLDCFKHLINPLQKEFHLLLLDTRGHGRSPKGEAPFTLRQFAKDLKELLEDLEMDQVHLLGFSDGANIALLFALDYPQCLKSLILVSGNFHPSGLLWKTRMSMRLQYLFLNLFQAEKKKDQIDLLKLMLFEPDLGKEDLQAIQTPALVISSDHDLIRKSHTREMVQAMQHASWKEIEGDHFAIYKKPKQICSLILSFLDQQPGS